MELYKDKTGNVWGEKGRKVPRKFYPLEIDYSQDEDGTGKMSVGEGSTSKLPGAVQQLVRMLFDVESMKKAMLEFEVGGAGGLVCRNATADRGTISLCVGI